jgi:hypothetical protein
MTGHSFLCCFALAAWLTVRAYQAPRAPAEKHVLENVSVRAVV